MSLDEVADAESFGRVQRANQTQVVGKLLHDLRNPVHSLRITVELFERLVAPGADAAALLNRAARYAPAAQSAMAALVQQIERVSMYLNPPRPAALQPVAVNERLTEIALLAREAAQPVELEMESSLADDVGLLADSPRLSHGLLAWVLQGSSRTLRAYEHEEGVCLDPGAALAPGSTSADVRTLMEAAGGRFSDNATCVVFRRR